MAVDETGVDEPGIIRTKQNFLGYCTLSNSVTQQRSIRLYPYTLTPLTLTPHNFHPHTLTLAHLTPSHPHIHTQVRPIWLSLRSCTSKWHFVRTLIESSRLAQVHRGVSPSSFFSLLPHTSRPLPPLPHLSSSFPLFHPNSTCFQIPIYH